MNEQKQIETTQDLARIVEDVWCQIDFDNLDESRDIRDEMVNAIEDSACIGSFLDYPDELAREMDVRRLEDNSKAHKIATEYTEREEGRLALRVARRRPRLVFLEMQQGDSDE